MTSPPIRRILVPLDNSAYSEAAGRVALDVARHHGAEVTGLAVIDSPGLRAEVSPSDYMHWPLVEDIVRAHRREAQAALTQAEDRFRSECEVWHVPHREIGMEGAPAHKILEVALLFDLLVIGQRTFYRFQGQEQGAGPEGDSLAKLLDQTSTPVLAVPRQPASSFARVVVAYDGSFGASRTLRDFVPMARPFAPRITVLSARPDLAVAESHAEDAAAFLRAHGFEDVEVRPSQDEILSAITPLLPDTDLIVAGIHSRRVQGATGPGSFTDRLLGLDRVCLFLSH